MKNFIKFYLCAIALVFSINSYAQLGRMLFRIGPRVTLRTNPEGCKVTVDGNQVLATTPGSFYLTKLMAKGRDVFIKIEKEGYETKTITRRFTKKELNSKDLLLEYTLTRKDSYYDNSNPPKLFGEPERRVSRDTPGKTALERTILRWNIDSDPRGARVFWRVVSSIPDEVKNTNETYLTSTPYEETRSFNILGLTYENSRDVVIEIKLTKNGYEDQVKRFNVRQALDQQEISTFFELVKKDNDL